MTVIIYTENESTLALKHIATVEGIDDPTLAIDALFDDNPRIKDREFVTVVGSVEDGVVERVTLPDEEVEIVQPRRRMIRTRGGEEAAPAPKKTTRRASPAKTAAAKTPAKRTASTAKRTASTAKKTGGRPAGKKTTTTKKTTTKAAGSKPAGSAAAKTVVKEVKKTTRKSPVSSPGKASGRANSAAAKAAAGKTSPFARNAASDE